MIRLRHAAGTIRTLQAISVTDLCGKSGKFPKTTLD
jgi:hypothetical protein